MATITIKDLPESVELDRAAMLAISGGARFRAGAPARARPTFARVRLFDFARGAAGKAAAGGPPSR